jgi:rare lipoprotein A
MIAWPVPPIQWGLASHYGGGDPFTGRETATGEFLDDRAMTAAHRTYPLNSRVRVTNLLDGRSVLVRVNDRGPFFTGRIVDLSVAAARELGMFHRGLAPVRVELIWSPAVSRR